MHAVASWFGPHQHGFVPGEIMVGKPTMNSPLVPVITSKQTLSCAVHLLSLHGRRVGIYLKDALLLLVCKLCILVSRIRNAQDCICKSSLMMCKQERTVGCISARLPPPPPPPTSPCMRAAGSKLLLSYPPS